MSNTCPICRRRCVTPVDVLTAGPFRKILCYREACGSDDRCTFTPERAAKLYRAICRIRSRIKSAGDMGGMMNRRPDVIALANMSLIVDDARNACDAI